MQQPSDKKAVASIYEVIANERSYLDARRNTVGIDPDSPLTGMAISGGGIRSATFALGVLQSMAEADKLKNVDYLSTVSGGGYIGSCMTSLLTVTSATDPKQATKLKTGLGPGTFPLTSLEAGEGEEFQGLSGRHQMHHLRRGGRYLSEQMRTASRAFQRLIGTFTGGMILHISMFAIGYVALVSAVHLLCVLLTGSDSLLEAMVKLGFQPTAVIDAYSSVDELVLRIAEHLGATFAVFGPWHSGASLFTPFLNDGGFLTSIGLGIGLGILAVVGCWPVVSPTAHARVAMFFRADRAGQSARSMTELLFLRTITITYAVSGLILMLLARQFPTWSYYSSNGHAELYLPIPMAIAFAVVVLIGAAIVESRLRDVDGRHRVVRSYLGTLRGMGVSFTLLSISIPVLLVILHSISAVGGVTFSVSLVSLAVGGSVAASSERSSKIMSAVMKWLQNHPSLIYGGAALAVLILPFAGLSRWLMDTVYLHSSVFDVVVIMIISSGLLVLLTVLFDANRLSPFRFYRDRIAEAFLRTQRIPKKEGFAQTIRSDEDLKLKDLGRRTMDDGRSTDDGRRTPDALLAPYHLITAALNLERAKGLLRADSKSIHFLFSPRYVGSDETGYIPTPDDVTVGDAVAVSGAAASSLAGRYSSFGQRFFSVLLNIRLGQWIINPRWHVSQKGLWGSTEIWLPYLMREVLGSADSTHKRIHVSDGGHTGDNLGLLPLLQRQCAVIIVIDGEQDKSYTFGSFNHAIRLALVEHDHRIDINLDPIEKAERSVVVGTIHYRGGAKGTLYYVKSSVTRPDPDVNLPEHVENYDRMEPDFPHQSTGDQFFDPEQFEAYRALGEYVGGQLVRALP